MQQSQFSGSVKFVAPDFPTLLPTADLCNCSNTKRDLYLYIKVKGKVVPVLNSLSTVPWRCVGEWRCSSAILDLGTRHRWVVIFMPQALCPGKELPLPIAYKNRWAAELVLMQWRREESLAPARNWTMAVQPVVHRSANWTILALLFVFKHSFFFPLFIEAFHVSS
jgi:hypothetical protein